MPAPKTPNTAKATVASIAKRTRAKHDRWAAEMREDRWLVVAEPRCPACGGNLDSMGDMTICVKCGDEYEDLDTLWDRAVTEARKEMGGHRQPDREGSLRRDGSAPA